MFVSLVKEEIDPTETSAQALQELLVVGADSLPTCLSPCIHVTQLEFLAKKMLTKEPVLKRRENAGKCADNTEVTACCMSRKVDFDC